MHDTDYQDEPQPSKQQWLDRQSSEREKERITSILPAEKAEPPKKG